VCEPVSKAGHDFVNTRRRRINREIRQRTIEWLPGSQDRGNFVEWIRRCQARTPLDCRRIRGQPFPNNIRICLQPDNRPAPLVKERAVRFPQDNATAGGKHAIEIGKQVDQEPLFGISKSRLTVLRNDFGYRPPLSPLKFDIRITPRTAEPISELTCHARLPHSAIAYQRHPWHNRLRCSQSCG
jgi:hypothetical protein